MRIHFTALAAGALLVSACAQRQTTAPVTAEAAKSIAGSSLYAVSEPDPRMRRLAPQTTVTPISINPLVLLTAVAVNAAASAIVAETSSVNDFSTPGPNIGEEAEAEALALVGEALKTTPASSIADRSRAFKATEDGDEALLAAARAAGANGLALNVRLKEHSVQPAKNRGNAQSEWVYAIEMTSRLTDLANGNVVARASCEKERTHGDPVIFKIASLEHAGGDADTARATWDAHLKERAAVLQRREEAKDDIVGINETDERMPDDPSEGFSTPEQEAAYMDHVARTAAQTCAREMAAALIGASDS